MDSQYLHNPHLDGEAFFWEGGPVGVFLSHGYTATAAEVKPFGRGLHGRGYTVAGPLLPGHGTTPRDLNRTSWFDWAAAGEAAYQGLKQRCQRVFLAGESMGGLLALYLASLHPEAAGVMVYSPAIKLAASPAQVFLLNLAAPWVQSLPKGTIDVADKWQGYPVNPLLAARQMLWMQRAVIRLLPQITMPILVMQGRLDTVVHPRAGEIILSRVRSRVRAHYWLEKSSHPILLDQELPEVTERSLEFISQN